MPGGSYSVKRRSERKQVEIPVIFVVGSEDVGHAAVTVDLSAEGMRLQSDGMLSQGQFVRLHLAASPNDFADAHVVWVGKTNSAGARQAGLEFLISPTKFVH